MARWTAKHFGAALRTTAVHPPAHVSGAEASTGGHRGVGSANARPPAVVLGGGVTAVDTLRSLDLAGVPTMLVTGRSDVARSSRLPGRRIVVDATRIPDMVAAIVDVVPAGAVLVPCGDGWARVVALLDEAADAPYRSSSPDRHAIDVLTDKLRFANLLAELEVPHPVTIELAGPDALDAIPDELLARCFLKPLDSEAMVQAFRRKAFSIGDRAQARDLVARAMDADVTMLLQQFVTGPARGHVFLDGFVDSRGDVNVLLARRRLRLQPARYGNSSLTEVIALSEMDRPRAHLMEVFDALGFNGPFCAEFVFDDETGAFLLIEINGRCWWQVGLTTACGANVPERIYLDAIGQDTQPVEVDAVGLRWSYPFADLRGWVGPAIRGERVDGGPPPLAWRGWRAITSIRDPAPAVMIWLHAAATAVRRLVRALNTR